MQNFFRPVLVQDCGELIHHEDVVFNLLDELLRRTGKKLYQKSASGENMLVRPDEYAETAGRGNLFALHQIGGEILRHFAGDEFDTADIRLAQTEVPADGERPVPADQTADVQFPVRPCREIR